MAETAVLIIGAGPLGLAAALRLAAQGQQVRVLDARLADEAHADSRILALSHGSRQLLETLGAWPAEHATSIETIHVSQRGALGRTALNTRDYGLPALGYVLPAGALVRALTQAASQAGIRIDYDSRVEAHNATAQAITLRCSNRAGEARTLSAQLAVYCEGRIDDDAGSLSRDYDQHALLLRATPEHAHGHVAWERFTPDGPIALLPLGRDYAVVWTLAPAQLAATKALPEAELIARLHSAFGKDMRFTRISERSSYPLGLRIRRSPIESRVVWLGNSAQTLHPVAGQGFNLGLRDVWELAESLRGQQHDAGTASALRAYARRRSADRWGAAAFTHSLVQIFSNDNPLLTHARGAGLLALDLFPPLRHFVAKRMIFGARAWP
ncbi:FAD-dependent monooxygenase [Uliginosibacterium sediminicola]|uniref:FAD-dependent monooxygenase n=1 Tax=Uliginosibacterium sediminicola TaxID=2024550 RepID=A0ABU9YX77_9RHOO